MRMPTTRAILVPALMVATLLAGAAGPSVAQDASPRDLTVEQAAAATAGLARPGSLKVSLTADRPDRTYAIGDTARLFVNANETAYVTVLSIGPSGQVTQLFPNQYQVDNRVKAGEPVEIAGGASRGRVTIAAPAGNELIKVVASNKPLTVISEAKLKGQGLFRSVDGGVGTLVRDLAVSAKPSESDADLRIAVVNVTLHTIESRVATAAQPAEAPGEAVVVVTNPVPSASPASGAPVVLPVVTTAAVPLVPVPLVSAFPLLLAVDKASYRTGEPVTLAVTSLQACYLTVLEIAPSGSARVLFPNKIAAGNAVAALQTVLVAGGPSPVTLSAAAPAGVEQLVALCSTDATPPIAPAGNADAGFTSAGDRVAVARNLSIAAARPAGSTAMASVTFTIQP